MNPKTSPQNPPALIQTLAALLVAGFGLMTLAGCATTAELPPQITQDLGQLRGQLLQGKAQVQTTCNAARDLTQRPQAQLEPQITQLVKAIAGLSDLATNHRQQFTTAEERADAYFAHWDKQMSQLSADLAEEGRERRAESMESFAELKARTQELKKEFRPFMLSLLEVSRYLQTDTTAAGVRVVTPRIKGALEYENAIMAKIDAVVAQIDAMRGGK
ncbi:MAG: hypothetical protein WC708_15790 [Lentisphaeria bacterium]